jgi:hypothetical protein
LRVRSVLDIVFSEKFKYQIGGRIVSPATFDDPRLRRIEKDPLQCYLAKRGFAVEGVVAELRFKNVLQFVEDISAEFKHAALA